MTTAPTGLLETAVDLPSSTDEQRLVMLYVHIPFCNSRCTFCDWVDGIPSRDLLLKPADSVRQRYIDALCREIRERGAASRADGHLPRVVYFGGGTASSLTDHESATIMEALDEAFDLGGVLESTIECSPDSVDQAKLRHFRSLGFTRVSSGVQSFDDARLRRLGRRHTAAQAADVVRSAREAGFDEVTIDLMSGFVDQEPDEMARTTEAALALPVTHLSLYSFRPTSGTFMRRKLDATEKRALLHRQLVLFCRARDRIREVMPEYASGYFGQVSAFAAMYFQARADTIGLGSGAVSIVEQQFLSHRKGMLHPYIEDPMHFDIQAPASQDRVMVSLLQAGLSMFEGLRHEEWKVMTGVDLEETLARPTLAPLVALLRRRGLVEDSEGIRLPASVAGPTLIELAFEMAMSEGDAAA